MDFIYSFLKSSEKDRWGSCLHGAYNLMEETEEINNEITALWYVLWGKQGAEVRDHRVLVKEKLGQEKDQGPPFWVVDIPLEGKKTRGRESQARKIANTKIMTLERSHMLEDQKEHSTVGAKEWDEERHKMRLVGAMTLESPAKGLLFNFTDPCF